MKTKTKAELIERLAGIFILNPQEVREEIYQIIEAHDREKPINPWDDIIFHPDDPRVVIGEEYEFVRFINTKQWVRGVLSMIFKPNDIHTYPFISNDSYGYYFIRPVRKPVVKKVTRQEISDLVSTTLHLYQIRVIAEGLIDKKPLKELLKPYIEGEFEIEGEE